MGFLLIRVPMEDGWLDNFMDNDVAKSDMECRISRELTGDDNEVEGITFTKE